MRLDKYLAAGTGLSRSLVHRHLRAGDVTLNKLPIKAAGHIVQTGDLVSLRGELIKLVGHGYWMLHKPAGYVCANRDDQYPTVLDLLAVEIDTSNLQIAGRLDLDTTGLVLITTDGDWNHRLTSPRHSCLKRYRLQLAEPLTASAQHTLEAGLLLQGETKPTKPAQVEVLGERELRLGISEGKYHQVKRMLAAVGNHVVSLHREAIGNIQLDASLAPGQYRLLSPSEITGI